jgi:hypothetical protein
LGILVPELEAKHDVVARTGSRGGKGPALPERREFISSVFDLTIHDRRPLHRRRGFIQMAVSPEQARATATSLIATTRLTF